MIDCSQTLRWLRYLFMFNNSIRAISPVNYTGQFTRNIVFCVVTDIQMNAHNFVRSYRLVDKLSME